MEELLDGYDAGRLNRRDLVDQLVELAGGRADLDPGDSTFRTLGLNHIALTVSDVHEMADFLGEHLGTSVIRIEENRGFLAAGANHFVGLFVGDDPGLNHVCFTVDGYEPVDAVRRLEAAGFEPHQNEDRVFFRGPDGIVFQIASTWGDYPG
jgi:catechol 2,3-dioxygenase-like lactoylglutathione lyase family enzyme